VNKAALKRLPPEPMEVEICRAEELTQRRGLTSELDAMWSDVGKKDYFRHEVPRSIVKREIRWHHGTRC
jgi:hypothetical protein